jgi:acylphosphatase
MPELTHPPAVRAHAWISGQVQGVFFRYRMAEEARSEGLAGWVRNLPDGRVEAVFEGPAEAVDRLVAWCRRGPQGARVADVRVQAEEPEGVAGFEIVG